MSLFGPASHGQPLRSPTHSQLAAALGGPVRELSPGDRPKDWLENGENDAGAAVLAPGSSPANGGVEPPPSDEQPESTFASRLSLGPQRYKVQFTASQQYVDLLEQASDLLGPAVAKEDLEAVHLRAMQLLVTELKRRKYAIVDKPQSAESRIGLSSARPAPARVSPKQNLPRKQKRPDPTPKLPAQERATDRSRRSRTIPAAVCRAVAERDGQRCAAVDERGQRCRETSGLELHHEQAYALGGPATASNISLRCKAHNLLAAEQDFGRQFMERKKTRAPAPPREL